jgi:hypothetical protein
MLGSPAMPSSVLSAMRAAAYAMDSVALPLPALASTTSVPAFWMRSVILGSSSGEKETGGVVCGGGEVASGAVRGR